MSTQGAIGNVVLSFWCGCSVIFTSTDSNDTPMMFAAHNGHADVVKILIDAGADAHTKNACVMLRIIMNMTKI